MIVFVTNISSGNISGSALSCSKRETASLFHGILYLYCMALHEHIRIVVLLL